MPTLKDRLPGKYIKALVFGRSKVGKTFGAGSFPRPCFIDCDSGIGTLQTLEFIQRYGFKSDLLFEDFQERDVTNRGVVKTANAFDDACRFFDAAMSVGTTWISPKTGQKMTIGRTMWDTLVIDTGTSLSQFAMNKALVLLGGTGFKGISSHTLSEAHTHGLVVPKLQDYGSERSMVEQFIGMCYNIDKHVLFLCHEKEISNGEGELQAIVPLLTGKGVEAVSALFDEVWNVRSKPVGGKTLRYIQTVSSGQRQVGSRTGMPNETEWDFAAIQAQVEKIRSLVTAQLNQQEKKP